MKFLEIIKYNGALFLTGLFFVFISSVSAGNLLLNSDHGTVLFILSGSIGLAGGAFGLYSVKGYEGKSDFVPDYFVVILPVTAFLVTFTSLIDKDLLSLYTFIWGFSIGCCFGLLIRSNPSPKFTGYPFFALGAFCGGLIAIPVLSGVWHISDTFAAISTIIALMPTVLFSHKLRKKASAILLAVIGFIVCGIAVCGSHKVKQFETASREILLERPRNLSLSEKEKAGTAAFLPPLLQPQYTYLKILAAEPVDSGLSKKISELPFVKEVLRAPSDKIVQYYKPFSWHSGLRKNLTSAIFQNYISKERMGSSFNVIIVSTNTPLSPRENRFYTKEFYKIASSFLMPGGVIITTVQNYKQASVIQKTMLKVFKNSEIFPGRSNDEIIVTGSNGFLTTDYIELDQRAVARLGYIGFCPGMLISFAPPIKHYNTEDRVRESSKIYDINSDLNPYYLNKKVAGLFSGSGKYLILIILAAYLVLRFFVSRKIERRIVFSSLENGIYCGGFLLVSLFILQAIEGKLFLYLGWLGSIFIIGSACGYGLKLKNSILRLYLSLLSAVIPATFLLYSNIIFQELHLVIICLYMFLAGFFGGIAANMFASKLNDSSYRDYLNWTIGGLAAGSAICWLFLTIPHMGLTACIITLAITRIPLIVRPLK